MLPRFGSVFSARVCPHVLGVSVAPGPGDGVAGPSFVPVTGIFLVPLFTLPRRVSQSAS